MNKRNKMLIILLMIIGIVLTVITLTGCTKKERYTWDEDGMGKDEWYEPDIPEDTPGFELPFTIIAIISLLIVYRRKRNRTT